MQMKFRRHEKVRLLLTPDLEYIEYGIESNEKKPPIEKGMSGEINSILPNGQYHVTIINKNGKTIAYAPISEEFLERTVTRIGTSGKADVPRKYLGKRVYVVITKDNQN